MIERHRVVDLLDYDPDTGVFRWKISPSRPIRAGAVAGYGHPEDWLIVIAKQNYSARRLAWLWMTGSWPEHDVRNINRDVHDVRWVNLAESTVRERAKRQHAEARQRRHAPGGGPELSTS